MQKAPPPVRRRGWGSFRMSVRRSAAISCFSLGITSVAFRLACSLIFDDARDAVLLGHLALLGFCERCRFGCLRAFRRFGPKRFLLFGLQALALRAPLVPRCRDSLPLGQLGGQIRPARRIAIFAEEVLLRIGCCFAASREARVPIVLQIMIPSGFPRRQSICRAQRRLPRSIRSHAWVNACKASLPAAFLYQNRAGAFNRNTARAPNLSDFAQSILHRSTCGVLRADR